MHETFSIGDKVEVTNNGKSYTTYEEMAVKLNATAYCLGEMPNNGDIATIKASSDTTEDPPKITIYLIETAIGEFLVDRGGLTLSLFGGRRVRSIW